MKSKVLDRPMFKKGMMAMEATPAKEIDPENVGIMSGFKDMLIDMELPEDEESEVTEKMLNRTPDSPEILMNNLRGDMRSVDARVEELADLVGYSAAAETPESVLALLQPVLATQQALAMPPMMPPEMPPGMPPMPTEMGGGPAMPPPPAMPPGGIAALGAGAPLMPPGQPPLQMAQGGIVQRFEKGSNEEGVTASQPTIYPQNLQELAIKKQMELLNRVPLVVPELQAQLRIKEPLYRQLLGTADREVTQGQMLFDIAQGGLNLAAGVDAEGRPLRGAQSPVSRFASAFSRVPGQIGARAAEVQKDERALRLAALQAAEKDIANIREQNVKLEERREKVLSDIIKASGQSIFGKADWALSIVTRPGFVDRWKEGKLNDNEQKLMDAALADFNTPTYENRVEVDPISGQPKPYSIARYKPLPKFLEDAMIQVGVQVPPKQPQFIEGPGASKSDASTRPPKQSPILFFSRTAPTMFNLAAMGTGAVFNIPLAFAEKFPIVGALVDQNQRIDATTFLRAGAGQVTRVLSVGDRFTEGERKQIQKDFDLLPSLIDRPEAYQTRVASIDKFLRVLRSSSYKIGYESPDLGPEDIRKGRARVREIDSIRELLGAPPRVTDFPSMQEFNKLPFGTMFVNEKGEFKYKDY